MLSPGRYRLTKAFDIIVLSTVFSPWDGVCGRFFRSVSDSRHSCRGEICWKLWRASFRTFPRSHVLQIFATRFEQRFRSYPALPLRLGNVMICAIFLHFDEMFSKHCICGKSLNPNFANLALHISSLTGHKRIWCSELRSDQIVRVLQTVQSPV